jgi:hypothetical protein
MVNSSRGPTHRLSPVWPPRTGACRESQADESTKQTCSDDRTSTRCKESLRENAACDRVPHISDKNRNSREGRPVTRSVRGSSPISRSSIHVRSQCVLDRWTSITSHRGPYISRSDLLQRVVQPVARRLIGSPDWETSWHSSSARFLRRLRLFVGPD